MPLGVPLPWVVVAFALACTTYVQDAVGIVTTMVASIVGRREDAACDLCSQVVTLVLKVSELDETDNIDCNRLCFVGPWKSQCVETCTRVQTAMLTSKEYPCVAAGLCPVADTDADVTCRFNWHPRPKDPTKSFLRCSPQTMCQRKFPARCEVKDGIRAWRRFGKAFQEAAKQMAHGVKKRPVCGAPDAGPFCVHAPSGLGAAAELGTWLTPMLFGTLSSIRAVETPGGDDDRQWLTFWVIYFGFSGVERFTDVLLSHVPYYFELKLALLLWLMFRRGADRVYRLVQRGWAASLPHLERFVPAALVLARSGRAKTLGELLDGMVGAGVRRRRGYFRALPEPLKRQHLRQLQLAKAPPTQAALDAFLQSECATADDVAETFGKEALTRLRIVWAHPTMLRAHLVRARGLASVAPRRAAEQLSSPRAGAAAASPRAATPRPRPSLMRAASSRASAFFRGSAAVVEAAVDPYVVLCLVPPPPPRLTLPPQLSDSRDSISSGESSVGGGGGKLARRATAPSSVMSASTATSPPAAPAAPAAPAQHTPPAPSKVWGLRRATVAVASPAATLDASESTVDRRSLDDRLPPLAEAADGAEAGTVSRWAELAAETLRAKLGSYVRKRSEVCGPTPPPAAYGVIVSHVRRKACAPVWDERFEMAVRGARLDHNSGSFVCREAPFTSLRLEVWHREDHEADVFLGEVTVPLVHLMDLEPHRGWHALTDPQGKRARRSGCNTSSCAPEVFLELRYQRPREASMSHV